MTIDKKYSITTHAKLQKFWWFSVPLSGWQNDARWYSNIF